MVSSDPLLQLHNRLDGLFNSEHPFGGVSVFVFGDLYQLAPVVRQKPVFQSPSDKYVRLAVHLWDHFRIITLAEIMRQK